MIIFTKIIRKWTETIVSVRLLSLVAVALLSPGLGQAEEYREFHFDIIAREILTGLRNTKLNDISASAGYETSKIALREIDTTGTSVSQNEATAINRYLLSGLQSKGGHDFHFVDRDHLEILKEEAERYGAEEDRQRHQDILQENSRVDIILVGRLRKTDTAIYASFQALAIDTGQILVSTTPRPVVQYKILQNADNPVFTETSGASVQKGRFRANVEQAEIRLQELGYDPGSVDGYLNHKTRSALREYQADSALKVTGRLTQQTFRNMFLDTRELN